MHTLTLADIERARRMDIADAQSRIIGYSNRLHMHRPARCYIPSNKQLRSLIADAQADIAEARRDIVALRHAR